MGPVALAVGYCAAFIAMATLTTARTIFGIFAPIGRMAFTNYVLQSLVCGWIFYGYGLGYFGRIGAAYTVLIATALYVAQLIASTWWLSRFRFGPLEWLWRTLTYGRRQQMTR